MKLFNQARVFGAKLVAPVAAVGLLVGASSARAATDPISTILASVDLTAVSVAVAAIALLIVGIKLTFKGPDVAKRVINKV